ncbi:pyridoxal phosphate-dependent decarboxylase family protein [Corynebacterium atypicum]|uniref:pyridoxal phosphate-dependent decarboxylase family protein n=1 Tax=Corynebacterium atypicum TaxID=191610 RepID=UPI00068F7166|nr:pyridoxal-dependent decarboxylase [Corynebacterium atypicum]
MSPFENPSTPDSPPPTTPCPPELPPPPASLHASLLGRSLQPNLVREDLHRALDAALDALESADGAVGSSRRDHTPQSIREALERIDLDAPTTFDAALSELDSIWLSRAVWYHDPRYLAHLNCPVAAPAVAAALMTAVVNTAVESWDQSTAAAAIEQKLIGWLARLIGFNAAEAPASGAEADGCFSSGGTQSNLHALALARNKAWSSGAKLSELRFITSPYTHYSVARAASLLGLEAESVLVVATDPLGRLLPRQVEQTIRTEQEAGATVAAVVATAGTTDRGSIDPLRQIATVTRALGVHLHVDAAYGGALLCDQATRDRLDGIALADTVTIDLHKGFFVPVACSALIARERSDLELAGVHADYLNPQDALRLNLADKSLQTTRRFDSLKLWLLLRTLPAEEIGRALQRCCALTQLAADRLAVHPRFELFERPQLSTVLFRPATMAGEPQRLGQLRQMLFDSGALAVASTVIGGDSWLKFTLLDPTLTEDDIAHAIETIDACALSLTAS